MQVMEDEDLVKDGEETYVKTLLLLCVHFTVSQQALLFGLKFM